MPRRQRRPEWWPNPRRDLERVAIERVVADLTSTGHTVTELWFPEHQPDDPRIRGRGTRPDGAMVVDGRDAAIDVTGFWTKERGEAAAYAASIRRQLEVRLEAARLPVQILGVLAYDPAALAERRRPGDRELDVEPIAAAIIEVARRDLVQSVQIPTDGLPGWLTGVGVTTSDHEPGRASVYPRPGRDPVRYVAEVLERIAGSKGVQLAPWGLGIVCVIHNFEAIADQVASGLQARSDWPWWRFYWMGPDKAYLLWDRGDHQPGAP